MLINYLKQGKNPYS